MRWAIDTFALLSLVSSDDDAKRSLLACDSAGCQVTGALARALWESLLGVVFVRTAGNEFERQARM